MATGKQMLEAVRAAIANDPTRKELRLSTFDVYDLYKLTPEELEQFGLDCNRAEQISRELLQAKLDGLNSFLGVVLVKDRMAKNLIPGEGIRRTAGIWANGNDVDPDKLVEEVRALRHPEKN